MDGSDLTWSSRVEEIAPLFRYADDSRGGEQGVVASLFSLPALPTRAGFAVEFGQRNITSGTVGKLVAEQGWGALFMDSEAVSPRETQPAANGRTITLAQERIAPSNIDALFEKHGVPADLDCLVIDIDGLDYWVWDALSDRYSPSLVIVEFNSHVPYGVAATIARDESWSYRGTRDYGASLAALEALATRKGYRLIHVHGCWNLYFVRNELAFPEELTIKSPLSPPELALLTDTAACYDALCDGRRPSWWSAPTPDVSGPPWQLIA